MGQGMTEPIAAAPETLRPLPAYRHTPGAGPTVVFLPGYASDMNGTKALALEEWARANGRAYLRFDYLGCGESEGAFEEQTLAGWRDDAIRLIDEVVPGPAVLVGSSMGGWVMLLIVKARPDLVAGMVGIAAAPDFTDWGFSQEQKLTILQHGRLEQPSPYSDQPIVTTRVFWASGEANRVANSTIETRVPVRLLHGQADFEVRWERSTNIAERLRSADVQTWLVKDGDHRLSRDKDIALIVRAVEDVLASCS